MQAIRNRSHARTRRSESNLAPCFTGGAQAGSRCARTWSLGAITSFGILALASWWWPRVRPAHADVVEHSGARTRSGDALYRSACVACHGASGRGSPPTETGLALGLPDFSDCGFSERESDEDWLATIERGGPARGFDPRMPAFGRALTYDEIQRIVAHMRTFCRDKVWPRGELNLPRALLTEKAFPEDEAILTSEVSLRGPLAVDNQLIYEKRIGARSQLELALPFSVREQSSDLAGGDRGTLLGIGDVAIGYKQLLLYDFESASIMSFMGELFLPTGSARDGLGSNTFTFEPSLTYGQILGPFGFIELQAGFELPVSTAHADRAVYARGAIGRSFGEPGLGRMWSPMIELMATHPLTGNGPTEWDYVPELQVTLSRRRHVRANAGVRMPLTEIDQRPFTAIMYLLWDWYDGGFFEGW